MKKSNIFFKNIFKKVLFLFIILLFFINIENANLDFQNNSNETYYADISIKIESNGNLNIETKTDNLELLNKLNEINKENLTSKINFYWILNLTQNNIFSTYFIELIIPENIEINYIKTKSKFRISKDKIYFIGNNKPIEIIIQYKIINKKTKTNLIPLIESNKTHIIIFYIIALIFIILLLIFFKYLLNNFIKTYKKINKKKEKIKELNLILTDTQKKILYLLQKEKKPITQKKIQDKLKIPKATLSRNILILEQKNIIIKKQSGMSNIILLNEDFINL